MFNQTELLILIIYSFAFTVSSATGFGGMLLFFGISSFLEVDIKELLFVSFCGAMMKSIASGYLFRENIRWKTVWKILIFAIPFVIIGGMFTTQIPSKFIGKIIGGFILLYLAWKQFGEYREIPQLSVWVTRLWAASWGFLSGLIGAGGPIIVALLNTLRLNKKGFVGTLQILFMVSILIKLPIYYQIESPYSQNIPLIASFVILALITSILGKKINNHLPEKLFQQIITGILFITAVKMLLF